MALHLDAETIYFTTGIIVSVLGISMAFIALDRKAKQGFLAWSACYFFGGGGLILMAFHGRMTEAVGVFFPNVIIFTAFVLFHRGFCQFSRCRLSAWIDVAVMTVALSLFALYSFWMPSPTACFFLRSGSLALIVYHCACISWRYTPHVVGRHNIIMTCSYLTMATYFLARFPMWFLAPEYILKAISRGARFEANLILFSVLLLVFISTLLIVLDAQRLKKELMDSRDYFQSLIHNIEGDYYAFSYNPDGVFQYISPAAVKLFGDKAVPGRNWRDLFSDDAQLLAQGELSDAQCCLGRVPPTQIYTYPRSDNQLGYLAVNKRPVLNKSGQTTAIEGIAKDVTQQRAAEEELQRLTKVDPLTGCFNRREFMRVAEQEIKRAQRYNEPLSLIMFDIDYFKRLNDRYGHNAGDEVLKAFVDTCQSTLRPSDSFFRIGGEEFIAILTATSKQQAVYPAQRLLNKIEKLEIHYEQHSLKFTVSMGLAEVEAQSDTVDIVLKRADMALYMAKNNGRNQAVVHDSKKIERSLI